MRTSPRTDGVHGGAVGGGAEGAGLEPGGASADLSGPGARAAHHGPAAVHELGLSELGDVGIGLAVGPVGPEGLLVVVGVGGGTGLLHPPSKQACEYRYISRRANDVILKRNNGTHASAHLNPSVLVAPIL
jgi:hypothetical protein